MAIYKFCNGNITENATITMTTGNTRVDEYQDSVSSRIRNEYVTLTFTSNKPPIEDNLRIWYSYNFSNYIDGNLINGPFPAQDETVLGIGQTVVNVEVLTKTTYMPDDGPVQVQTYTDYDLIVQQSIPVCYVPPSCTLGISGVTVTHVTTRGGSDGEIYVAWTGSTGTTTVYLNGTSYSTSNDYYNFTGLSSDLYDITIVEGDCIDEAADVQVLDGEFRTLNFSVTSPATLAAVENPVTYKVGTAETAPGTKAEFEIKIIGTISDGDYIKFDLTAPQDYSQTFYAKGFPNKDNYFLASVLSQGGVNVGTNTNAEITQSLADALERDVVIGKTYDVIYNSNVTITLRAKEFGNRFTLDTNNVTKSGSGIQLTTIKTGVNKYDGQQIDNYSIYAEVYINSKSPQYPNVGNKSDYIKVSEIELPFQQDNIHKFDLSPILKNFVSINKPDYNFTGYTIQPNAIKPYYLKIGERYPLIANTNTKKKRYKRDLPYRFVINSALDWYSENDMETYNYLGDRFHNIIANFDGEISLDDPTSDDVTILIDDYLYDTGNTDTTNIEFRFVDETNTIDSGWITANTYTFTTAGYRTGRIYISGVTEGVIASYDKSWWAYPTYDVSGIEGYNTEPDILNDVKFLTDAPNPKLIQRESQEYLYFILQAGYDADLDLKGDIEYYDGTSTTGVTFFNIQTSTGNTAGGVLALNLSYNKLGLSAYENSGSTVRKIKNITFAVYQTDTNGNTFKYTEDRSYRLEINDRPRKYGIIFQNRLGGYDSFDFVGIVEDTINRESSTYTLPIDFNQDGSANQGFKKNAIYNTKITKKVVVNSGWVNVATFNWLIDLMKSNEIYSYTEDNQNYLVLDSFKYIKSSLDDLFEIEATFIKTIYENSISV